MQHVGCSSLTRDRTLVPCIGSAESQPLDNQGSPALYLLFDGCSEGPWTYSLVGWSGCDTGKFVCMAWSPATPSQPQHWFPNPSLLSFLLIWSARGNSGGAAGGTVRHKTVISLGLSLRICFLQETTHLSCIGIQNTVWVPAASDFVIAQNSNSIRWFLCLHP